MEDNIAYDESRADDGIALDDSRAGDNIFHGVSLLGDSIDLEESRDGAVLFTMISVLPIFPPYRKPC